jgi:hypothetical protein
VEWSGARFGHSRRMRRAVPDSGSLLVMNSSEEAGC